MRCTQIMGLPQSAYDFLKENVKHIPKRKCPHCGEIIDYGPNQKKYDSAASEGMFDDGPDLYEYELMDGKKVREVVQVTNWSSGPCIFLKLVDEKSNDLFTWNKEDIQKC